MESSLFNRRFTGAVMVLGAVMVTAGFFLRPVALQDTFDLPAFLRAHENEAVWVWSFRVLVFGLFMEVMGLVSLASLLRRSESHTLVSPGVVVCCLALLVAALAEGYFMHMGAWAGWKVSTLTSDAQLPFLQTLEPTREWVVCLTRMGYMFFCMGLSVAAWGLLREGFFPKWLGFFALALGVLGIVSMLAYDSRTDFFVPVRYGFTLFFLLTGALLLKSE